MTPTPKPSSVQAYDHENDPVVVWLMVDGRHVPLTESKAWEMAWGLISLCVDSKQARGGAR